MSIYYLLNKFFRPFGKIYFLSSLSATSKILDVGCGNNSSNTIKTLLPNSFYTGIDICNYNQTKEILADSYILTISKDFSNEIGRFENHFDAVISNHNLEHCDDRNATLFAMMRAVNFGGKIFLAFPSEFSTNFPSRFGTLNYYDDNSHKYGPPSFDYILSSLSKFGFIITYANKNYSPKFLFFLGLLFEPFSRFFNRNMIGTWEYYGFESIIIAEKIKKID
jgi:SAM-dependent methyltransferase